MCRRIIEYFQPCLHQCLVSLLPCETMRQTPGFSFDDCTQGENCFLDEATAEPCPICLARAIAADEASMQSWARTIHTYECGAPPCLCRQTFPREGEVGAQGSGKEMGETGADGCGCEGPCVFGAPQMDLQMDPAGPGVESIEPRDDYPNYTNAAVARTNGLHCPSRQRSGAPSPEDRDDDDDSLDDFFNGLNLFEAPAAHHQEQVN